MVVKEKKGRKRYILFSHAKNYSRMKFSEFLSKRLDDNREKIKMKIIKYDSEYGILRVDHSIDRQIRENLNSEGQKMGIKTIKTSGTLKGLSKS